MSNQGNNVKSCSVNWRYYCGLELTVKKSLIQSHILQAEYICSKHVNRIFKCSYNTDRQRKQSASIAYDMSHKRLSITFPRCLLGPERENHLGTRVLGEIIGRPKMIGVGTGPISGIDWWDS